jgi:hypothetical protein
MRLSSTISSSSLKHKNPVPGATERPNPLTFSNRRFHRAFKPALTNRTSTTHDRTEDPEFREKMVFFDLVCDSFLQGVTACFLMSTRSRSISENSLSLRLTDDYVQSAVSIRAMAMNGAHDPAKRELRFLLEATVKYLLVDQRLPSSDFSNKLQFLKDNVPRSSVDIVDDLVLSGLSAAEQTSLKSEVKDIYAKLSAFVHPSITQIQEDIERYRRGEHLGFESAKEVERFAENSFRVFDIVLVLLFHGVGLGLAGDIFTAALDRIPDWKFHKGKYMHVLSRHFDYKVERKRGEP